MQMSTHEYMHTTPSSVCQEEHRCRRRAKLGPAEIPEAGRWREGGDRTARSIYWKKHNKQITRNRNTCKQQLTRETQGLKIHKLNKTQIIMKTTKTTEGLQRWQTEPETGSIIKVYGQTKRTYNNTQRCWILLLRIF